MAAESCGMGTHHKSKTEPPLNQNRARGVFVGVELIYSHFFLANAKMNVETFPPSFWVMSIRLIWSAKICDLSDSNSGWAAPGHSSHRPKAAILHIHWMAISISRPRCVWISNVAHTYYIRNPLHHLATSSISHLTSSGILHSGIRSLRASIWINT